MSKLGCFIIKYSLLKSNPEVVLLIGSAKSYNYKYKVSKKFTNKSLPTNSLMAGVESAITYNLGSTCGQSYKHFTLVNYDSRVVKWGIFQSGTTLES